jgi:hypothetical protein
LALASDAGGFLARHGSDWTLDSSVVGLLAIHYSTTDAGEQVSAMRAQLKTMGRQLAEMQEEGRAWIGPVGASLVNKSPEEPLKVSLAYRNFGKQPAVFLRNQTRASLLTMKPGEDINEISGWKDPKWFNPLSMCQTKSFFTTVYPSDTNSSMEGGVTKQSPVRDSGGNETPVSSLVDEIVRQQALYIFFGCFTYLTAGNPQMRTFCVMLDPRTANNNSNLSTWEFAFCPYGNDDEDYKANGD